MEMIPALRHLGIGLIPYSPLHAGLLAGVLEAVAEGRISDASALDRIEPHRDQLEACEGLCRELGAQPADSQTSSHGVARSTWCIWHRSM